MPKAGTIIRRPATRDVRDGGRGRWRGVIQSRVAGETVHWRARIRRSERSAAAQIVSAGGHIDRARGPLTHDSAAAKMT